MNIDTGVPSSAHEILASATGYVLSILPEELGQAEVYEEHSRRVGFQAQREIRRFQVTVHDVFGMSVLEAVDPESG